MRVCRGDKGSALYCIDPQYFLTEIPDVWPHVVPLGSITSATPLWYERSECLITTTKDNR